MVSVKSGWLYKHPSMGAKKSVSWKHSGDFILGLMQEVFFTSNGMETLVKFKDKFSKWEWSKPLDLAT